MNPYHPDALDKIRDDAAYFAERHNKVSNIPAYEMIEGLAQALIMMKREQRQGWAPVLEERK